MISKKNIFMLLICSIFLNVSYAKYGNVKLINVSSKKTEMRVTYKICSFSETNPGCTEAAAILQNNSPLIFSGDGYISVLKAVEIVDGKEVAKGDYANDYGCTANMGWNEILIFNDYNADTVVCSNGYGLR